ncbi:hypothetical protein [Leptospira idonii]|uniref:TIGR04452 family lipoprotein n=1 Tax=Leptospira idonii TaxID=1193500 RepID=A0A4R9M112_9LEPT|nr:hypothetical protein [Leptospira idonii]TGN19367.1 hypothetical protein EHS15_08460 [Leptospira idonii]
MRTNTFKKVSSAVAVLAALTFVGCTKSSAEKKDDTTLLTYLVTNQTIPTGPQADCLSSVLLMNQCITATTKLDAGANCSYAHINSMVTAGADYAAIKTKVVTKYNSLKCNLPENAYTLASDAITAFKGEFPIVVDGKETTVFTAPTYY